MPHKDPKKRAAYQAEYSVRRKALKAVYDHSRVANKREQKAAYDKEYAKLHRSEKNAYALEWYRKHPEEVRNTRLMRTFKITASEWAAKLATQGFKCAICKTEVPKGFGTWHTDHNHACCSGIKSCGKCVRGLLCYSCNSGLARFKDSPELLRAAAIYIEEWRLRHGE
jgi:ribosomal protein L11 methylase PrmA